VPDQRGKHVDSVEFADDENSFDVFSWTLLSPMLFILKWDVSEDNKTNNVKVSGSISPTL
jgi:hypothetical protein